ncbi:MAG: hypothetical protein ACRCUY_03910 [Thermoguttaceae bacterium]
MFSSYSGRTTGNDGFTCTTCTQSQKQIQNIRSGNGTYTCPTCGQNQSASSYTCPTCPKAGGSSSIGGSFGGNVSWGGSAAQRSASTQTTSGVSWAR